MQIVNGKKFLKALGVAEATVRSGVWLSASCPLAPWTHDGGTDSNPSFAINCTPGKERFNCYTCKSGDLFYLLELLSGFGAAKPKYNIREAVDILCAEDNDESLALSISEYDDANKLVLYDDKIWDEGFLSTFMKAVNVPLAMEYLHDRNVSKGIAEDFDLRWDTGKEAVAFPIRNWDGKLVGMRGRRIGGGYYDYSDESVGRNKYPWFGEVHVSCEKTVLMVESVFDLVSAYRVYKNVVAPLSVGMSKWKVLRMQDALDIVTLFDNGVGGDKARWLIDKYLPSAVRVHLNPPAGLSDPGEMSVDQLKDVLSGVLPLEIT